MVARRGCSGSDLWNAEKTTADRLFLVLDRRRIKASTGSSAIEVLGVHAMPEDGAWVQLAIVGQPAQGVVLHLLDSTTVEDVIEALNTWVETPTEERPRSIDLAPLA